MIQRPRAGRCVVRLVLAALVFAFSTACSDQTRERVVWHPIRSSFTVDPDSAIRVSNDSSAPAPEELRRFARRLRHRTTLVSIGVSNGDPEYTFGMVWDAEFLDDESLAVLDRQASLVRLFALDGSYRSTIGGLGEGPGELNVPLALVLPAPESLWIVDGPLGIHRFRWSSGQWQFEDRIETQGRTYFRDACASAGSVVVHASAGPDGKLLAALDDEGSVARGFAAPYRYHDRFVVDEVTRGRVTCSPSGSVIMAYERLGRVDAYDGTTGDLVWHTSFEDVRPPPIRERMTPRGLGVGLDVRDLPSYHLLLGVAGGGDAPIIVQYAHRTAENVAAGRADLYDIDTYVLDPRSGHGVYAGDDVPQVLAVRGDHLALLYPSPYPVVEIARLGPP